MPGDGRPRVLAGGARCYHGAMREPAARDDLPKRRGGRRAAACLALLLAPCLAGCPTTAFYQRERLADRAMQIDEDEGLSYLRNKTEAAREGSFGGYGAAAAGGCGCQ